MSWLWEVDPPEMQSSGEQVLLTYTIRVTVPQKLDPAQVLQILASQILAEFRVTAKRPHPTISD